MNAEDRAWRDFSDQFREYTLPKILSSAMFLSIQADDEGFDVKQAAELGAALLLGKPLLLVVPRGRTLPDGLRRAASVVLDEWDAADPQAQDRLFAAVRQLTEGV